MSANGKVLVVGAPRVGRIYVYVRPADGAWKSAHQTVALDGYTPTDGLGASVAVSADGSTIVAGAPEENGTAGAVYVYVEPPGGWKDASVLPTNMFHDPAGTQFDRLGGSVAISGNGSTVVAGAAGWHNDEGAIYLFTREHGNWARTKPERGVWANVGEPEQGGGFGGQFGQSVAISQSGETIVVGAPNTAGFEGAIYVLKRRHDVYKGYRELQDLASGTSDSFSLCTTSSEYGIGNPELGVTVAVSSDGRTIASGEPCAGTGGQAVVYNEPGGGWLHASSNITAGLTPLRPNAADTRQFGIVAAVSGDGKTVIAGDPSFTNGYGAFVGWFQRPQHGWSHVNPPVAANFGTVSGRTEFAYGLLDEAHGDPIAIGSIGGTLFIGGVGTHNEGAVYAFNEKTAGSTPTDLSCASPVPVGLPSTCTVTVSNPPGSRITPTGIVRFSSNGGAEAHLGKSSCRLKAEPGKSGTAQCSVGFTGSSPGAYTISAHYGGDLHHSTGDDSYAITTPRLPTITTVGCFPSSVAANVDTTCSSLVIGLGAEAVTIAFKAVGADVHGETCSTFDREEDCRVSVRATRPGHYTVVATYPGDDLHAPSSAATKLTVTG